MTKLKKTLIKITALIGATSLSCGFFVDSFGGTDKVSTAVAESWRKFNATVKNNVEDFYDKNVVYQVPETVAQNEEVSVIVSMNVDSVMAAYKETNRDMTISEYALTDDAKDVERAVVAEQNALVKKLKKSGLDYELGNAYDTIISGFEVIIKAKDYGKLGKVLGDSAELILGETYLAAETTKVITNEVDVYETGIFDSSSSEYSGDGVVVAVLDSGLDYTHSAFDVNNFEAKNPAFTLESVSNEVQNTVAAGFTAGLKGEDVYVNAKIPFAYDYADKDSDVLPTNSDHGTHVSGIIAGRNNEITGVAPDAQIAFMKVFSDTQDRAKTSWILAAVEDCVVLGVDVMNMSLGSSCGFTTERDNERINEVYNSVAEAGISLIVAAANDANATRGSEKNGSLGLTSNPDSGTVGSPSTFEAALSVASVDGVKTPYMKYGERIIYFNEATDISAKPKHFVDDILDAVGAGDSHEFEYVTIPGVGRASDYSESEEFYEGKIVLVKRGILSFEDKIKIAINEMGAAGIIVYNNVSGTIGMSVGKVKNAACCSISQDDGEVLAASESGKILISREQKAGPFMSDFSSWGPTSDLKIKPEITAHGGEIYSCIPGEAYERQSGTSMASPNQAGATALIREYVKYDGIFGDDLALPASAVKVTSIVNQLMMSTTDIVMNKDGLPYAVRKQGAGLVNITKATTSAAYLTTYDLDGNKMTKAKFELGDDKNRTGVYEMKFDINNISEEEVSYLVDGKIITEGVSETYTGHDDTTVTQEGHLLSGAKTTVVSVDGGEQDGNTVSIEGKGTATVVVRVTLSDEDKAYLESSFEHGMYVEGFITLEAKSGTKVNLNAPFLTFYGDWTEAPIFDEEYYDTHKDEINNGLDVEDKLMADAYATRVLGSLHSEYITTLGSYYFIQNPSATQIAASKEHMALSNQENSLSATINGIYSISAGLLRNVREVNISVVEDVTGREIWSDTSYDLRKSRSVGSAMYGSTIEMDFKTLEQNLKNNTKYTVTVSAYIDYGSNKDQKNVRNVFEFPLYIDLESPTVTDVSYRTEYDETTKKTRLFADLYVYDNHYAQALQFGQITHNGEGFVFGTFGKYMTPVYSSFNSTSKVSFELTDYIADLKNSATVGTDENGKVEIVKNSNTFVAYCYDYAMNTAIYEFELPDEVLAMNFETETLNLSPNETKDLGSLLDIYPSESWLQLLDFESNNTDVVDIINRTAIAKTSGDATVTVTGYTAKGVKLQATLDIHVLAPGEAGYNGSYTVPKVNKFSIDGYTVNKAFYAVSTDEREIGLTGASYEFGGEYKLSMFPSENVVINTTLDSYFMDATKVTYQSSNKKVATVNEFTGEIEAKAEGTARIIVSVTYNGQPTSYSGTITVTVKDPYTTNSIYLMSYKGLGGEVIIPDDRGITTIYSYAFSNYEYVPKGPNDVVDEEDPYLVKQQYIGEDTITKIVIPEGVTTINAYAFAKLTALEEVVLPKSLTRIGVGAFYGCQRLSKINLHNVKFINGNAFYDCGLGGNLDLTEQTINGEVVGGVLVAVSDYAFANCSFTSLKLPATAQSIGIGAFYYNTNLVSVEFKAPKVNIGKYAFSNCEALSAININAAVISARAFQNCKNLKEVELGKDVSIIGEYAFANTAVAKFDVDFRNETFTTEQDGAILYKGEELVLVAPKYAGAVNAPNATSIATGALSGNRNVWTINAPKVTVVGDYAFAGCTSLDTCIFGELTEIGAYAFYNCTALKKTPDLSSVENIGAYAFYSSKITSVEIADGTTVGDNAFAYCSALASVEIGANAVIGNNAFYASRSWRLVEGNDTVDNFKYYVESTYDVMEGDTVVKTYLYYKYDMTQGVSSVLKTLTVGEGTTLGARAFEGNAKLTNVTLGKGVKVGDYAFYNATDLKNVDLSGVASIGAYAFSGKAVPDLMIDKENNTFSFAVDYYSVDGKLMATKALFTSAASNITSVSLTNVTELGTNAFENNLSLETVTFGEKLAKVSDYAFSGTAITELSLNENIVSVGAYAFNGTAIENVDLSNVDEIGAYAFAVTNLKEVTLKDAAVIGNYAFASTKGLVKVNGLENAKKIGDSAFMNSALEAVALTNVEELGSFAFADSAVTNVTFGASLTKIGENPFAGCAITDYATTADVVVNGQTVATTIVTTYDVSDTVKVINGAIYSVEKNGLQLVSYPMASTATGYVVEEGTVRISARAFEGSLLQNVTLASTLKAIGHKAFFACENLSTVVFKSYDAPLLEEEYDANRITFENLPFTGNFDGYEGLGITKFYMWNIGASPNAFYQGANFEDYIGHCSGDLVMVKPANGKNYDSFIFAQYFGTVVEGSNAAMDSTLNVIALIAALPDSITLSAETVVTTARKAYDSLPSLEQKALVQNYEKLTEAESMIEYLKNRQPVTPGGDEPGDNEPTDSKFGTFLKNNAFGLTLTVLVGLAFAAYVCAEKGLFTKVNELIKEKLAQKKTEETVEEKTEADALESSEDIKSEDSDDNN